MMQQAVTSILEFFGMQQLHFESLWPLYLLPLVLLPFVLRNYKAFAHPCVSILPKDNISIWVARAWRACGALALTAVLIALTKPYLTEQQVEKVGRGAHVMIVLDRSASMNDSFAKKTGQQNISKMEAARQVLKTLVKQSSDDLVGMVTFSTSPILTAPLGSDRVFVQAALDATEAGGMGFTAVARGLGMGLDYFEGKPVTGARAILLVSDGGAHIDGKTQDMLRAMFLRQGASLYWIYLRSVNGASLKQVPSEEEGIDAYPEYALHEYFQSLHVPYHVYEAENHQAVFNAMQDIAKLKNKPTRYFEPVSRNDVSWLFYLIAWFASMGLLALYCMEVKAWRSTQPA